MRKILFALMLSIILFEFLIIDNCNSSEIDTIYVDDNYDNYTEGWEVNCFSKIQDAINASKNEYTIFIYNGKYFEHIIIDKSVKIIGEDNNKTIIDGESLGNTISINSDNVSITNLTIQNCGTKLNNSGLEILSNNNIIYNNIIINNSVGIYLNQCYNNIINQNIINNILYGIGIDYCDIKNEISYNTIYNSTTSGIYVAHSFNNEVFNNNITKSNYGIALSFGDQNIIKNNIISKSIVNGIYLYFCNDGYILNNVITDGQSSIKVISSRDNLIDNNIISNFSTYGIDLFHSDSNDVNGNIISYGDTGIFVASNSLNNEINDNIFSSNNQKIFEEPHKQEPSNIPGFEFILAVISMLIILKRKICI